MYRPNVSYKHVFGRKINTGWNLAACHQIEEIIIFSDGDFEVDIYELRWTNPATVSISVTAVSETMKE